MVKVRLFFKSGKTFGFTQGALYWVKFVEHVNGFRIHGYNRIIPLSEIDKIQIGLS